jgi:hypothetical protein
LLGSKDAQARESFFFGRLLHKDRFRKIHFTRDGLHLVIGEAIPIRENREGIAFEARGGKNVKSEETMVHGWWLFAARASENSDALELGDGPFVGDVSGVESGFRFNQDDVHFFVGGGAMFDSARDDDEFAFVDDGFMVAELHAQHAFDDEKQFIFVFMMMPDEFAFQFDCFDLAIVYLADDARVAVVGEQAELLA